MIKSSEAQEQAALFEWAAWNVGKYPELALMFHVPNGGSRNAIEAANLKRQGVKAGVPDIFLPAARGIWHGLFIELKVGKNKTSEKQKEWLKKLNEQKYLACVCWSWEEARTTIECYLSI